MQATDVIDNWKTTRKWTQQKVCLTKKSTKTDDLLARLANLKE